MKEVFRIVITGDGSHTLYIPELDEHYHSTFGAITESLHIFVNTGFNSLGSRHELSVFEIGFGTGLNALLTHIAAAKRQISTTYHSIENHPLDEKFIQVLNYSNLLTGEKTGDIYRLLHEAPWGSYESIGEGFKLHKIQADFMDYRPDFSYDVVYYDAFAPDKQPEMWLKENFKKVYKMLNPGGVLVTYCVKGQVKRHLKEVGFYVETLPGPPGKRQILRARKR